MSSSSLDSGLSSPTISPSSLPPFVLSPPLICFKITLSQRWWLVTLTCIIQLPTPCTGLTLGNTTYRTPITARLRNTATLFSTNLGYIHASPLRTTPGPRSWTSPSLTARFSLRSLIGTRLSPRLALIMSQCSSHWSPPGSGFHLLPPTGQKRTGPVSYPPSPP